jgi:hypothetical protein
LNNLFLLTISIPSKNKRIITIKNETTMKLAITSFLLLSGFAQSKEPKTKTQKLANHTTKALKHKHIAAERSHIVRGRTVATTGDYPFFGKLAMATVLHIISLISTF